MFIILKKKENSMLCIIKLLTFGLHVALQVYKKEKEQEESY